MKAVARIRTSLIRILVGRQEAKHMALMGRIPAPVVVLGFPRSGTSLVAQLASTAGYHFGDSKESLRPDTRNPKGYFEHGPLFRLSREFLREAAVYGDLDPAPYGLSARGPFNRLRRAFTRRAMMSSLEELAQQPPFGIKLFPRFYYFWKQYLPSSAIIIAVYREPISVARSFLAAWPGGRYGIDQILALWTEHNRDLLFQIQDAAHAVLIKYEDLLDPVRGPHIMEALEKRLGHPINSSVIDLSLNRSAAKKGEGLLPAQTQSVFDALEAARLVPEAR